MAAMKASPRRRRLAALAVATSVAALTGAQAFGDGTAAPAGGPRLTADPLVVQPGGALTLHGSGFPHRARLTLLAGAPHHAQRRIGSATTGSRGVFVATIRIRARSAAGTFVASACSARCHAKASVRFHIAAP